MEGDGRLEKGISTGLTEARRGRKFGVTIGSSLLVLTAILTWQNRGGAAIATGGIGVLLFLAGLTIPTLLVPIERWWMKMSLTISKVTTPIVLGVVYFAVMTPTGVIMRRLRGNPLVRREAEGGFWIRRNPDHSGRGDMTRQF